MQLEPDQVRSEHRVVLGRGWWGEGARPFQGEKLRLRLLEATSYDSSVTLLRYEPLDR